MSTLLALAFSDLHLHKFRNFDVEGSRLKNSFRVLNIMFNKADQLKVPLLFCGDLVHDPKNIDTEINMILQEKFDSRSTRFIAIDGNHDQSEKSTFTHYPPSHLQALKGKPNFHILNVKNSVSIPYFDDKYINCPGHLSLYGVPYMSNDKDLHKAIKGIKVLSKDDFNILMLHTDIPGAKTPEGMEVRETEYINKNLDEYFKQWDLVLCGHIHLPQKLSKKVYMLGSPIHQTVGDAGVEMGYWEVYSDRTMKFKPLKAFPKFIRLKKGEIAPDNDNYYIAYDEVLEDEEVELGEFNINKSKGQLAKKYCKVKGIKSKSKKRALIKVLNSPEL